MSRVLSVANIKRERRPSKLDLPDHSTLSRQIYDTLYARRGRPVDLSEFGAGRSYRKTAINRLTDFYGCDIRHGQGRCVFILCGEWFGSHYDDYVIEAINAAENAA